MKDSLPMPFRSPDRRRGPHRRLAFEALELRQLLASLTVFSAADDGGEGTLRWAILQANSHSDSSTIRFAIPGNGPQLIRLASPLPAVTSTLQIDGTTQPGTAGRPLIQIDGSQAGQAASGLTLLGSANIVRGLAFTGFAGAGLLLQGGSGSLVEANVFGVSADGTTPLPNQTGIQVSDSSGNTIGGDTPATGNLIAGNRGYGILLVHAELDSSSNLILGNRIGTTADGMRPLPNGQGGILIAGASRNQIGGIEPGQGNVISGNIQNGVLLTAGATENVILGNLIGVAADGRAPLGNKGSGIALDSAPANFIGGSTPGSANVISANLGSGVVVLPGSTATKIQGNAIGTDLNGALALGNGGDGVTLGESNNAVGGTAAGAGNIIAYNGSGLLGAGVQLTGLVNQNSILSNSIHDNAGLGINLGSGPTPNNAPGQLAGPNNFQNYPIFSKARTDGRATTVLGTLSGAPNSSYLVQLFWSQQGDPSGYGEGRYLLGSRSVTTDATGGTSLELDLSAVPPRSVISATATDQAGNTSEFSPFVAVKAASDLTVSMRANPDPVANGTSLTYSVIVTNAGELDAHNVVLAQFLPTRGMVISAVSSQGSSPVVQGQSVTANVATLAAGASVVLTVQMMVQASPGSSFSSSASVQFDEIDQNPADNTASVTTKVATASADLRVQLGTSAETVRHGDELTWTVLVTNQGLTTAHNAGVSLPLGSFAYVSSSSPLGSTSYLNGNFSAAIGDLQPGSQATITIKLRAAAPGAISSTASVRSDEYDLRPEDNLSSVTVNVLPVTNLSVKVAAEPRKVASGQDVTLRFLAANSGDAATHVVLTGTLPAGLTFLSASSDVGNQPVFVPDTQALTAEIGSLTAGATATIIVKARATAPSGTDLITTTSLTSLEFDSDLTNNHASATLPVRPVSTLALTMTAAESSVPVNQRIRFDFNVTNHGDTDEPNAFLSIPLPDGLSVISAAGSGIGNPEVSDGVLTIPLGAITSGSSARVSVELMPSASLLGSLTVTALADGRNVSQDPTLSSAFSTVSVTPSTDLATTVLPQTDPANQGAPMWYTLRIVNQGPCDAANVQVSSRLPANVDFLSASCDLGGTILFKNGVVSASLGTLTIGQEALLKIAIRPALATQGTAGLSLLGQATADTFEDNSLDNTASGSILVAPSGDLGVSLATLLNPSPIRAGDSFVLTATVTNNGPSTARGVRLELPMNGAAPLDSVTATQGTVAAQNGILIVSIPAIDPGGSAKLTMRLVAASAGPVSWSASVSSATYDLVPDNNQATTALRIQDTPGTLSLASANVLVNENAGYVDIPVVRTLGNLGAVSVRYLTGGGNAVPGADYTPVIGFLDFADGETVKTIRVPVLANPHNNVDQFVGLAIDSPTGGAKLGTQTTTIIQIHDLDPDFTPPLVSSLRFSTAGSAITGMVATFSEPMMVQTVLSTGGYQLADLGTSGQANPAGATPIPLAVAGYDAATQSVSLVPSQSLLAGHFYRLIVSGSGVSPLRDLAGNPLASVASGSIATDYVSIFGRGTALKYIDSDGDQVSIKVTGGGYLNLTRNAAGEGQVLTLQDGVTGRSTITGSITRSKGRARATTTLAAIEGLGTFGQFNIKLASPPFIVRQLPFFQNNGRPIRARALSAIARGR